MPIGKDGGWYPTLSLKQLEIYNANDRKLLVSGPRLSGKCVGASTIIQVDGRLARIGNLLSNLPPGSCGQEVHRVCSLDTNYGKFQPADSSCVWANASTKAFRFVTDRGYEISTSPIHPLWTCVKGQFSYRTAEQIRDLFLTGEKVFVPIKRGVDDWTHKEPVSITFPSSNKWMLRNLRVHDRIAAVVATGKYRNRHQISKASEAGYHATKKFFSNPAQLIQKTAILNESLAYLLGVLVGDGCMTLLDHNVMFFSSADKEIIQSVGDILREHFPGSSVKKLAGKYDWRIQGAEIRWLIKYLNMGKYAHEKSIPDEIVESPKCVVRAFLQGLFDTDGCSLKNGFVEYCSASKQLADDVQQLLLAFGVRCRKKFRRNACRGAWHLNIWGDARVFYREIGFRLPRKQARSSGLKQSPKRNPMSYPDEVRGEIKRVYMTRHSRGAIRGNIPRHDKHKYGFEAMCGNSGASVYPERLSAVMKFSQSEDDQVLNQYFLEGKVFWEPIVSVEPEETMLYDLTVPAHSNFLGNGFVNHNSFAVLHKICRHLFEVDGARVAMFSKTLKNAKDGGTWSILHRYIIPEWVDAKIGFRYTSLTAEGVPGPKVDGQTRTPHFRLRNCHGGESELMLFSLDYDDNIEDKIKSMEFSMIYFSELDRFRDRKILSVSLPSLRMSHLTYDQHQWISDTNPSDEGESSWIYKVWYVERSQSYDEYSSYNTKFGLPTLSESEFASLKDGLRLIEVKPEDNPWLDPRQLEELKTTYAYDVGLYERYVNGKWVWGAGDSSRHFRGFFKENIHVVGTATDPDPEKWEILVPTPTCFELITGWDLGDVNHAACVLEKLMINGKLHFLLLDELVSIKQDISYETFTDGFMEIIQSLEATAGHDLNLERAWSDRSSLEKYSAAADSYPHLEVLAASGHRIYLQAAAKGKDSVRNRVRLLKQLLQQKRILISANCTFTIQMLKDLKKGNTPLTFVIQDENKHIFDALTYALFMECAEELEERPATGKRVEGFRPVSV